MTLIEIMVVVAIISLILGGVGLLAFNRYRDAQIQNTKNQTTTLQQAIEQYRVAKRGQCPKTLEAMRAAGFVSRVPKDAWGRPFRITCPSEHGVDVVSAGPDGEFDTADDLSNAPEEESGGD